LVNRLSHQFYLNLLIYRFIVKFKTPSQAERPYEGMNIFGIMGLNKAQKATLKMLGAVENIDNTVDS